MIHALALVAAAAAAAVLLQGQVGTSQPPHLDPVDEGGRHADFLAIRTELRRAVADRNVTALLRVVHPDIKFSFGDDHGVAGFRRHWRLAEGDSDLWRELAAVLDLGGTFTGPDSFVAPYVNSRWPNELSPFDHVALVAAGVVVRSAPTAGAPALATLSHAILRLGGDRSYPQRPWTAVVLPDGRAGYVEAGFLRSPIDYRAYFVRSAGRWQLTMFLAGD